PPHTPPTLFPYTTLFRSHNHSLHALIEDVKRDRADLRRFLLADLLHRLLGPVHRHWERRRNTAHGSATCLHHDAESPFRSRLFADRKSTRLNSSHGSISY